MNVSTPDLCDAYPDLARILEPIFKNYGGKTSCMIISLNSDLYSLLVSGMLETMIPVVSA